VKSAEQWCHDLLDDWMAGKRPSPEKVKHYEFTVEDIRKIQANALRWATQEVERTKVLFTDSINFEDGYEAAKKYLISRFSEQANQLDPQNEKHH
jgi:hypothetical protein